MPEEDPKPDPKDQGPQRPDGVSETEWTALGDPGKTALVRERERAHAAERALAAARQAPKPAVKDEPKPDPKPDPQQQSQQQTQQPDLAKLIADGITAAMKPLLDRDQQREAATAAERIRDRVEELAKERFHDASDALAQVDLTTVTDGSGKADDAKVTTALEDLLKRKPHLGKPVDDRRRAAGGSGGGGPSAAPLDDRVKDTLAQMQAAAGLPVAKT